MSKNCSAKRSLTQPKRTEDVKRSTMCQQRLGTLALLYIESDLLSKIDIQKLVDAVSIAKTRKVVI